MSFNQEHYQTIFVVSQSKFPLIQKLRRLNPNARRNILSLIPNPSEQTYAEMYFAQKAKLGVVDEEALALTILPTYAVGVQIGKASLQILKEKRSVFSISVEDMIAAFEYHKDETHTMIIKYSIHDIKVLCATPDSRLSQDFDILKYLRNRLGAEQGTGEAVLFGIRLEHEVGMHASVGDDELPQSPVEKLHRASFENPDSRRMKVLTKINGIIQDSQVFKRNTATGQLGNVVADINYEILKRIFNFFAADIEPTVLGKLQFYQQGAWEEYQKEAAGAERPSDTPPEPPAPEPHWSDLLPIRADLTEPEKAIELLDKLAASMFSIEEAISRLNDTLDEHLNHCTLLFSFSPRTPLKLSLPPMFSHIKRL